MVELVCAREFVENVAVRGRTLVHYRVADLARSGVLWDMKQGPALTRCLYELTGYEILALFCA